MLEFRFTRARQQSESCRSPHRRSGGNRSRCPRQAYHLCGLVIEDHTPVPCPMRRGLESCSLDPPDSASYAGFMSSIAPLIAESWERSHRRRNLLLLAATASAIGALLVWWASGQGTTPAGSGAGAVTVRPSAVLVRSPYMGIATCHQAQTSRSPDPSNCYRIGVAVWLKRPAEGVRATSANDTLALSHTDRWIQAKSGVQRREFIGFFKPTGIVPSAYPRTNKTTHATPGTPVATLKLTIVNSRGRALVTRLRVPVESGWG